ncbi:unnamed protein product [Alopecurus aequalis]
MSSPANRQLRSHWASLHEDLVLQVGGRVLAGDLLDYVRFRVVCTYWRSTTICPRGRGITDPRFHPRRWMMLPEGHGLHPDDDATKRRFFNLSSGALVRPRLPLLASHRVICTVEGLLLVGQQQLGHMAELTICLLHPFTGDVAHLPPLSPLKEYSLRESSSLPCQPDSHSISVFLSVGVDGVATVMVALTSFLHVLFATTEDKQWSFSPWSLYATSSRVISFQGKLYTIQLADYPLGQQVFQIGPPLRCGEDGSLSLPPPKAIASCPSELLDPFDLAECDSEILVIGFSDDVDHAHTLAYRVADLVLGRVLPVTSIGGNTLFLDIGRGERDVIRNDLGRSMTASHKAMPTIEGDTIVRCHPLENYIGQYHLSSGSWSPTMRRKRLLAESLTLRGPREDEKDKE